MAVSIWLRLQLILLLAQTQLQAQHQLLPWNTARQAAIGFVVRQGQRAAPQRRYLLPRYAARATQRRRQPQALPIFDKAPGDNALPTPRDYPIFIYNGSKGELIVNTMLSTQRYPMLEPVPGQVLYPPTTPIFRPKPLVERFRLPGSTALLNLTLIPFYTHEAISPPTSSSSSSSSSATTPATTTAMPTADLVYESLQSPLLSPTKRKRKKAKQYSAYHSPQEVQWQPQQLLASHKRDSLADNHRHYAASDGSAAGLLLSEEQLGVASLEQRETSTLPPTTTPTALTSFQIVYVDDSLERAASLSSTTARPLERQSSRYALQREYYAFPVYTLGKLLQAPESSSHSRSSGTAYKSDAATPTWFILNSRYKGPYRGADLTAGETKYYTSKYVDSAIDAGA